MVPETLRDVIEVLELLLMRPICALDMAVQTGRPRREHKELDPQLGTGCLEGGLKLRAAVDLDRRTRNPKRAKASWSICVAPRSWCAGRRPAHPCGRPHPAPQSGSAACRAGPPPAWCRSRSDRQGVYPHGSRWAYGRARPRRHRRRAPRTSAGSTMCPRARRRVRVRPTVETDTGHPSRRSITANLASPSARIPLPNCLDQADDLLGRLGLPDPPRPPRVAIILQTLEPPRDRSGATTGRGGRC